MSFPLTYQDAVVPAGSSSSNAMAINGLLLVAISALGSFTGQRIGFYVRAQPDQPFQPLRQPSTSADYRFECYANKFVLFPRDVAQLLVPLYEIYIATYDSSNNLVSQPNTVTFRFWFAPV
jgi:hypothetical protein